MCQAKVLSSSIGELQEAPDGKKRQPAAIKPHEYRTAYKVIDFPSQPFPFTCIHFSHTNNSNNSVDTK